MNAHIWELDRCENWNGRLLKQLALDLGLLHSQTLSKLLISGIST